MGYYRDIAFGIDTRTPAEPTAEPSTTCIAKFLDALGSTG